MLIGGCSLTLTLNISLNFLQLGRLGTPFLISLSLPNTVIVIAELLNLRATATLCNIVLVQVVCNSLETSGIELALDTC